MAVVHGKEKSLDSYRLELIRLAEQIDAEAGIGREPDLTAEQIQERMRAQGIRPEENILSSEILRMRYGDEEEQ